MNIYIWGFKTSLKVVLEKNTKVENE